MAPLKAPIAENNNEAKTEMPNNWQKMNTLKNPTVAQATMMVPFLLFRGIESLNMYIINISKGLRIYISPHCSIAVNS